MKISQLARHASPVAKRTILMGALLFIGACAPRPREAAATATNPSHHPILLVGIDGMEWSIAAPLIAAGRMPNCAALMARGRAGKLGTIEPTLSPVIWTSVVTSKIAPQHGIHGFIRSGGPGEKDRLYDRRDRMCKALWSIYSDAGFSVRVIGWWLTWPVEPLNGVMVAQTNTLADDEIEGQMWKGRLRAGIEAQVHPAERQSEMLAIAAQAEAELDEHLQAVFGSMPTETASIGGRMWQNSRWSLLADEIYRRAALSLAKQDEPADLSLVYFGGADVLGHRLWRFAYPEGFEHAPTADERAVWGKCIEAYYLHLDRVIGELLAAWPADTNVFIVSDHGMHGAFHDRRFDPTKALPQLNSGAHANAPAGVFLAAGPDINPSETPRDLAHLKASDFDIVASIFDLTPTLLELYAIPRAKDMHGSILFGMLKNGSERIGMVEEIASHDVVPSAFSAPADALADPAAALREEQLRALGYLGGELDPAAAPKKGSETPSNGTSRDGERK